MFTTVRESLYAALLPQLCINCREQLATVNNRNTCDQCWERSTIFEGNEQMCRRCGLFLSQTPKVADANCWQCDGHHYDRARAVGKYEHALAATVIGLKTAPILSKRVNKLLLKAFELNGFESTSLIVPVPLSRRRYVERGFNQSEVIAQSLATQTGIKIDARSLSRERHSPIHRMGMDRKARDLSVKDAFRVLRPNLIADQEVLLIDDVYTTGATVSYCAKVLKKNGARVVNVLTIARAVSDRF
ncbi:MAG: ComF family protein [Pyrinomonadaceae bacterium]